MVLGLETLNWKSCQSRFRELTARRPTGPGIRRLVVEVHPAGQKTAARRLVMHPTLLNFELRNCFNDLLMQRFRLQSGTCSSCCLRREQTGRRPHARKRRPGSRRGFLGGIFQHISSGMLPWTFARSGGVFQRTHFCQWQISTGIFNVVTKWTFTFEGSGVTEFRTLSCFFAVFAWSRRLRKPPQRVSVTLLGKKTIVSSKPPQEPRRKM